MIKNIFDKAKFGDKFLCKNGRLALYISPSDSYENESIRAYSLTIQYQGNFDVLEDGRLVNSDGSFGNNELNIISRYQESINNEKLNEFAEQYAKLYWTNPMFAKEIDDCKRDFKAGYYKALEEKYIKTY